MTERVVLERRASTVLYHYLRSVARKGVWLLPANVCPIVPAVFQKAGIEYEFVDIDRQSLCMDPVRALSLLRKATNRYGGVLFVRSFGHSGDFRRFFRGVKAIDADLKVIDDRCLARPRFRSPEQDADLELYSTGYSKFVDLGWGGWGILRDAESYLPAVQAFDPDAHAGLVDQFHMVLREHNLFNSTQAPWLDMRTPETGVEEFQFMVECRIEESVLHKESLNAIYAERLEAWAAPAECRDWRFTLFCDCQQELIRAIFAAGHFASAHFASLAPMFGPGDVPVADWCGKRVVNLFNDFRYDEDRARQLANMVRRVLQDHSAPSCIAASECSFRGGA
jgi:hypothetical protein